jgi:hypothetical protein
VLPFAVLIAEGLTLLMNQHLSGLFVVSAYLMQMVRLQKERELKINKLIAVAFIVYLDLFRLSRYSAKWIVWLTVSSFLAVS